MLVALLDDGVQLAEVVAVGLGDRGAVQGIGDGLVVLVNEQDDAPPGAEVQGDDEVFEASGGGGVAALQAAVGLQSEESFPDGGLHLAGEGRFPLVVGRQALEEIATALEERLEGADEQTLAEATGSGQEVVLAWAEELAGEVRLVDVLEILLADLAEGLDAKGEADSGGGLAHGAGLACLDSRGWEAGRVGRNLLSDGLVSSGGQA